MNCDVSKPTEGLENELWRRWSNGSVVEWVVTYVKWRNGCRMNRVRSYSHSRVHSPTFQSFHLRHNSFSKPSVALPMPQLILQTFRFFTYVIGTSPMSQLILQLLHRFTYITGHSTTLPLLLLRHRHFAYFTWWAAHEQGDEKNSLWWTSLLQQVTKFRSSYSFG